MQRYSRVRKSIFSVFILLKESKCLLSKNFHNTFSFINTSYTISDMKTYHKTCISNYIFNSIKTVIQNLPRFISPIFCLVLNLELWYFIRVFGSDFLKPGTLTLELTLTFDRLKHYS